MNMHAATHDLTLTLDALSQESVAELGARYARGTCPEDMRTLDGDPTGRMLSVVGIDATALRDPLARFAAADAFPWEGKSFRSQSADTGRGINRVLLGGRHLLFPFATHFAPSRLDGRPCVTLDYDLPDNPGLIRAIHDEVREVAPGLFLGPAMWKGSDGERFVLWFALDTRAPAPAIRW